VPSWTASISFTSSQSIDPRISWLRRQLCLIFVVDQLGGNRVLDCHVTSHSCDDSLHLRTSCGGVHGCFVGRKGPGTRHNSPVGPNDPKSCVSCSKLHAICPLQAAVDRLLSHPTRV